MTKTVLVLVVAAALACMPAAMGHPIDAEQVRQFRVGETSRADAEAVLGQPLHEMLEGPDSVLTWMYHQRDPGGAHGYRSTAVSLRFGPDGRLKERHDMPGAPARETTP